MQFTLAPLGNFDVAAIVAAAIALAAYRARALGASGAFAAFLIGTATFGALGGAGAAVVLTFFLSSVALSRLGRARKRAFARDVAKGDVRDAAQVFANGAVAAFCALVAVLEPHAARAFIVAFAGAFAAAAADTWATELGTYAGGTPRSILTGGRVATGLSGGVTWLGSLAALGGAALLGLVATLFFGPGTFVAVTAGGLAGAFVDSLLGASLQPLRYCPYCQRATEREPHSCGANTRRVRGLPGFNNDAVNFVATLTGAAVAYALVPR